MADEMKSPNPGGIPGAEKSPAQAEDKMQPGGGAQASQPAGPGAPAEAQLDNAVEPEEASVSALDQSAEIETLSSQIGDLTDRLLRAHAEIDNLRKRFEKEREETAKYAITKFARDIVGVSDNFQRAISAVPADAAASDPALKSFLDGVSMTEREFLNVMDRHGIKKLDPKGEPFDPHQHQAMMEQENASVASGTVLDVYQAGFVIEDRVLRPAMVVVSRGGPKQAKPEAPADPAATVPSGQQKSEQTQSAGSGGASDTLRSAQAKPGEPPKPANDAAKPSDGESANSDGAPRPANQNRHTDQGGGGSTT